MPTTTTRLALSKPLGTETVDIDVLNANADKLDAAAGATICTSAARPASPYNGQIIYETDTKLTRKYSGGWKLDTGIQPVVKSASARNAIFPSPTQGDSVWRDDLGAGETYYAAYNASTNPGGRTPAGWYSGQEGGLVPITPTSVSVGSGSATVSSNGQITLSSVGSININNVFSGLYRTYKIIINIAGNTSLPVNMRLRASNVDSTAAIYQWLGTKTYFSGVAMLGSTGATFAEVAYTGGNGSSFSTLEISDVYESLNTMCSMSRVYNNESFVGNFWHNATTSYDGFTIFPQSSVISGTIQVFGYRK